MLIFTVALRWARRGYDFQPNLFLPPLRARQNGDTSEQNAKNAWKKFRHSIKGASALRAQCVWTKFRVVGKIPNEHEVSKFHIHIMSTKKKITSQIFFKTWDFLKDAVSSPSACERISWPCLLAIFSHHRSARTVSATAVRRAFSEAAGSNCSA